MVTMLRSVLLTTMFVLFGAGMARSAGNGPFRDATGEWAVLGGYGTTHRGFGATHTQVQTVDAILRYGHFLSGELGQNWLKGRHEVFLELPLHLSIDQGGRSMTGGYILGSWKFTSLDQAAPYVFAGGGILFNDLGLPTQGTRLNYSYQAGTGLQYVVSPSLAVTAEYRYHHVSNAGTAEPNEPLNSSKFLFGVTLLR